MNKDSLRKYILPKSVTSSNNEEMIMTIKIAQHMNCADANPGADAGMYDSLRSIHALNMDTSAS